MTEIICKILMPTKLQIHYLKAAIPSFEAKISERLKRRRDLKERTIFYQLRRKIPTKRSTTSSSRLINKLNFNAIDEESCELNNNSSPKKINFDVFNNSFEEAKSGEANSSSREYQYFEVHGRQNSQKSSHSKNSDSMIDKIKIKTDLEDQKAIIPDANFISPKVETKHRGRTDNNIFDYESARRKQSFEYSDNDCQMTPTKRNTRSSKNKDLLSPVTRVLGLDSKSKVQL